MIVNYGMMAVPLFIFMGNMLEHSGIAEKMYDSLYIFFGKFRGGLAIVSILLGTIMAACVGIIAASITILALVAFPSMMKRKYDKSFCSGAIIAGGCLGILIPPSTMIIVYGPAANISVGKLFMGAFGPGFLLSGMYLVYIIIRSYLQPEIAPAAMIDENEEISFINKLIILIKSIGPVAALILSVMGAIYFGIASPTEASATGAVFATLITIIYKHFSWKVLKEVLLSTIRVSGMVFLIASASTAFVSIFLMSGGGDVVGKLILSFPGGKWVVFLLVMLICFILGMLIDWVGIIFIMVPILAPIIPKLGFNPIWFAMMVIVNLQMSFMTPPLAYGIFFLKGCVSTEFGLTTNEIIKGVIPYIIIVGIALVLLVFFPQIILWLPTRM